MSCLKESSNRRYHSSTISTVIDVFSMILHVTNMIPEGFFNSWCKTNNPISLKAGRQLPYITPTISYPSASYTVGKGRKLQPFYYMCK